MRLSTEIRLGSLLVQTPKRCDLRACAIGMANLAAGFTVRDEMDIEGYDQLFIRHPWLRDVTATCPFCQIKIGSRFDWPDARVIWHVFDEHVMHERDCTIEQLADFIESIDPTPHVPELNEAEELELTELETASRDAEATVAAARSGIARYFGEDGEDGEDGGAGDFGGAA